MSQDECSTEAHMCTRRKPKEGTTRSGATAPTERHCADKAPVLQQGATHKGSKTKSPFCVVLKTYHLDTWILHKTCLKHSNFLNRKTVCPIVSTWNIMATAMGQGTEGKQNKLRQCSKHGKYNLFAKFCGSCATVPPCPFGKSAIKDPAPQLVLADSTGCVASVTLMFTVIVSIEPLDWN